MRRENLRYPAGAVLAAALMTGCGGTGSSYNLPVGSDGSGGTDGAFSGEDASASGPLDAEIDENHVAVKFVTPSCAGDCATVEAVASGGSPPYGYAWEDGSTNPTRTVCPTSSTNYSVKVSDTGSTGEFTRARQVVQVALKANVLSCADAGATEAEAGPPVYWANWAQVTSGSPGTAMGTLSPPAGDVQVSYAGEVGSPSAATGATTLSGAGPVTFSPASTFMSATVGDAPPPTGMIAVSGTGMITQTITFSVPVQDPLIAVLGLGNPQGGKLELDFNATPTILSSGSFVVSGITSSGTLTVSGQGLTGVNGAGVIQFTGAFRSLSFTMPTVEQLYDFGVLTVGMRAGP
jgi:hypothetical protein